MPAHRVHCMQLHDLDNSTAGEATYRTQLLNITQRLLATGSKLQYGESLALVAGSPGAWQGLLAPSLTHRLARRYALTTPFMPDRTVGNQVVQQLNAIATTIMQSHNIPVVDLYSVVTNHCGAVCKQTLSPMTRYPPGDRRHLP